MAFVKIGLAVALVGCAVSVQANAATLSLSCASTLDDRYVTIEYDNSAGTLTCGPYGTTPPPEGNAMAALGYNLLEKDDGVGDNNNGGLLDISGIAGTGGSFTVDGSVVDGILLFKFGGGATAGDKIEPDWISFFLNGVTGGTWSVTPDQQSLSHASLYGSRTTVPEPTSLALLGLGLMGLGFARRKRSA